MILIDETHVECEGKVYKVVESKGGSTCTSCACRPCKENAHQYSATCYALIGRNAYLKRA